jgi:hypothetical protein
MENGMSEPEDEKKRNVPADPAMRRGVSRRGFLTQEVGKAGMDAVRQLPTFGGLLGMMLKETPAQRDERLAVQLWKLLMGRPPKDHESAAGLELLRNAKTPDEKGDALVDIAWALCQTREFEELKRPDEVLLRGFYRIALDREPTEQEKRSALEILTEATEPAAHTAALEGLFSGLIRSWESVLRKSPAKGR